MQKMLQAKGELEKRFVNIDFPCCGKKRQTQALIFEIFK